MGNLTRTLNPKNAAPFSKEHSYVNPIMAGIDEKNRGGDTGNVITAMMDPGEIFGPNRTETAAERSAAIIKSRATLDRKKRERRGYASGGQVGKTSSSAGTCKGMGAATRGGRFGKNG